MNSDVPISFSILEFDDLYQPTCSHLRSYTTDHEERREWLKIRFHTHSDAKVVFLFLVQLFVDSYSYVRCSLFVFHLGCYLFQYLFCFLTTPRLEFIELFECISFIQHWILSRIYRCSFKQYFS